MAGRLCFVGFIKFPTLINNSLRILSQHANVNVPIAKEYTVPNLQILKCRFAHHASSFAPVKHNVLVLDESDKEIGVMKWNRLKSLSIEKGLKIYCVDENAQPHAIYKLLTQKTYIEFEKKQKSLDRKSKVHEKSFIINSTISKNDLAIKIEKIVYWLGKNSLVKIKICFPTHSQEKKNFDIYNEIIKATSSISKLHQSHSTDKEISLDLLSNPVVETPDASNSNLKPLSFKELKSKSISEKSSSKDFIKQDAHSENQASKVDLFAKKGDVEKSEELDKNRQTSSEKVSQTVLNDIPDEKDKIEQKNDKIKFKTIKNTKEKFDSSDKVSASAKKKTK